MKHLFLIISLILSASATYAQDATYHLPKTAMKLTVTYEKKSYTPGELAAYARRFLKKNDVSLEKATSYRILDVDVTLDAVPDTSRTYTAHIDQKHNIQKLEMSENNILLAINAEPKPIAVPKRFGPARKPATLDPYKYLNQDILAVGSKMKMAELCAQEIYDIRDSKNELNRGQAEYMPKDGEQLRLMLENLNTQEAAINQMFEGVTITDTVQADIVFVPEKEVQQQVLFRFSEDYGLVDSDDYSGAPYYINIEDLHTKPESITEPGKKAPKDETGIWIVLPGKIRATISTAEATIKTMEFSAAQFGDVENLNEPLFTKKFLTSLILHPFNGGIDKIESLPVK